MRSYSTYQTSYNKHLSRMKYCLIRRAEGVKFATSSKGQRCSYDNCLLIFISKLMANIRNPFTLSLIHQWCSWGFYHQNTQVPAGDYYPWGTQIILI